MHKKTLILTLALSATLFFSFGPTATVSEGEGRIVNEPSPEHSFDCGEDEPPSGPYLDPDLMQLFDYDCTTGLLTPSNNVPDFCLKTHDPLYDIYRPVAGACAIVNEGNTPGRHEAWIFMAVVGSWYGVDYITHTHGDAFPGTSQDCEDDSFSTLLSTGVTYGTVRDPCKPSGCDSPNDYWYAHATAKRSGGTWDFMHHARALGAICR